MSVVLLQTYPTRWSWSRDPIVMSFYNPGDTSARLRFEVYISDRYAPSGWRMVYDGSQTFTKRVTKLELQRILDSELVYYHNHPLTPRLNYGSGNIPGVVYEGQSCRYKVRYGLVTESYISWDETAEFWCLKGGMSQEGYLKAGSLLRDNTGLFAVNTDPIVLHQGLWLQHQEAPLQISFLYRETGYTPTLNVILYDAARTVINMYTFGLEATVPYGSVIHLSMKVDLTNVSYVEYEYIPDYSVGPPRPSFQLAYVQVTPKQSGYRLYSYINSLGGTDLLELRNNKSESLSYEEQVIDLAEPIGGENYPDARVYPQRQSFRRERLAVSGDVQHLMAHYGTRYYKTLFQQLRQLAISEEVREYQWGYVQSPGVNRNGPAQDDGLTVSDNAYRLVPVNVTSNQINLVNGDDDEPTPFSVELTRSAADSQWLLDQRSCSSNSFAILNGGERYARLSFLINATAFILGLNSTEARDNRVGIDNGEGLYSWNTFILAYSGAAKKRMVNVDFFYMPHIVTYSSIVVVQTGITITHVSGQVPAGTQSFTANGGQIVMFDATLPHGLLTLDLSNNLIATMPLLVEGMTSATFLNNEITGLTDEQVAAIVAAYKVAGAFTLVLQGNSLTEADMDKLLIALDASGYTGGHLDIRLQNLGYSPSFVGMVAASNLIYTKGWTINI